TREERSRASRQVEVLTVATSEGQQFPCQFVLPSLRVLVCITALTERSDEAVCGRLVQVHDGRDLGYAEAVIVRLPGECLEHLEAALECSRWSGHLVYRGEAIGTRAPIMVASVTVDLVVPSAAKAQPSVA